ncbi:MAG: fused MFS/spermidine synthase [Phycisphaerales bacterium]|nr:fused MFS/spermidine synthase [Phycisphaerales bacterium]
MSSVSPIVFMLFLLSGATGLVYELVWTRELIFVFGGTTHAISTVLVAFMGGLGLGSYLAGRFSRKVANPGRAYGAIEIIIGVYALAVPMLLNLADPIYRAIYRSVATEPWLLTAGRFVVGAGVLLVPTTLMGATLPLLVRYVTQHAGQAARWVGVLYGINTLGAVAGTLATGFYLIPVLGLTVTTGTAAGLNIAIGVAALALLRRPAGPPAVVANAGHSTPEIQKSPDAKRQELTDDRRKRQPLQKPAWDTEALLRRVVLVTFALSGFAAMVYQIAWTRALILSIGSSTYSFTCILATFIFGLALGSLIVARWVDRWRDPAYVVGVLQLAVGGAAVLIQPIFGLLPYAVHAIVNRNPESHATVLALEFGLVAAITLVPTVLLGMLFPLITRIIAGADRDPAAAAGRAYAINTLGTVIGSFLAGFVMIRGEWRYDIEGALLESSGLGAQNSIIVAALASAAIGALLMALARGDRERPSGQRYGGIVGFAIVGVVGLLSSQWDKEALLTGPFRRGYDPSVVRETYQVDYLADGVDMTVAVSHARMDIRTLSLSVNAKSDASTALGDMTTQLLLGHLPALMTPEARRVCVIGLGSGMTVSAIARHPQVERIDCIEISEEVIRANEYFAPFCDDVLRRDPRVRVIRNDGRNHLLLTTETYDLIVSEPSNPWIAGVANLFTREFFQICERKLRPGGAMCLWLQGYTISLDDFRLVVRTLNETFPFVSVWATSPTDYAMVAGREPFRIPLETFAGRISTPSVRSDLYRIAHTRPHDVLGRYLLSGEALRAWTGPGPIHTDDNAILEFSAPRQLYRRADHEIALSLAERAESPLGAVVAGDGNDPPWQRLLAETDGAREARKLRIAADGASRAGDDAMAARLLFQALERDPTHFDALTRLLDYRRLLASPESAGLTFDADAFIAAFEKIRFPTRADPLGESVEQITTRLREEAAYHAKAGRMALALAALAEAHDLTPANADVTIEYAAALHTAGSTAAAVELLLAEVAAGRVTMERVRETAALESLRSAPEFGAAAWPK